MNQNCVAALLCLALAATALAPGALAAASPMAQPPSAEVLAALRSMRAQLVTHQPTPVFELYYSGPIAKPFGPLCYGFAGYSETCTRLSEPWLTQAAPIQLYAPGGVPWDLLAGYQLLVRFPQWTEETFKPLHQPQSEAAPEP